MSLFSECAEEFLIRRMAEELKQRLDRHSDPKIRGVIKDIGRYTLTLFDWTTPEWAKEYDTIFREDEP